MTIGNPYPSKGTVLSIGTTASDGSSDTFEEIGLIVGIGEMGKEHNIITFQSLKTGAAEKLLGGYDAGNPTLQLGKDLNDAGQAACKAALGSNSYYNFKLTQNDATATLTVPGGIAFKAKVASFKSAYDLSKEVGATIQLAIKADSFTDTAASSS